MDIIHKIGLDICKAIQNVEQTFLKYFFEHATIRYSFVMMIHAWINVQLSEFSNNILYL